MELTVNSWIQAILCQTRAGIVYPTEFYASGFVAEHIFDGIDRINIADSYSSGNNSREGFNLYMDIVDAINRGEDAYAFSCDVAEWLDRYETVAANIKIEREMYTQNI